MTEATSWRGTAAQRYGVAGHQSDHFHSGGIAIKKEGGGGNATWLLGLVARGQSNLMRLHRGERGKNNDGGMAGGWSGGETSGRKYYITLCTSTRPWQQSNTLDLRSSLSTFFLLVKTEAGGLLEKETRLDCLRAGSVRSVDTQSLNV